MGAYEQFKQDLLAVHIPLFQRMLADGSITFGTRPNDNPMTVTPPSDPAEQFLENLFSHFAEVANTFERLKDTETYVRQYPFRSKKVNKVGYLLATIDAHLNEIYVLEKRLETLAKFVERAYRSDPRADTARVECRRIATAARQAFKAVTSARSRHVHQSRHSDLELRQLHMMYVVASREPQFKKDFELVYKWIRAKKARWVREGNVDIESVLDLFFAGLSPVVFTGRGRRLQPPATTSQRVRPN